MASVQNVVNKLVAMIEPDEDNPIPTTKSVAQQPTVITSGIDNIMLRRAKCCMPLPEEDVVGYVTRGRGIMIHRRVCPNILNMMESEPERITAIQWPADGSKYPVSIRIVTVNRHGLLNDITTIFSEFHADVVAAKIKTLPNNTAEINVTIAVKDIPNLQEVLTKVSQYADVISMLRSFGRTSSK